MPTGYEVIRDYLRELFRDEQKERFGEVREPWDFWGNVARFWGMEGARMPRAPRRGTYVNPQWGEENIKVMKEILEE